MMAKTSSDMKQVTLAFLNYAHSKGRVNYRPDDLLSMEDLIKVLAKRADLTDAGLFINYSDAAYFESPAPRATALSARHGEYEFKPEILNFPIGYSIAIYPDLNGPSTMTPLLWTRGLQNYETFDAPYSGHVAFLDGHTEYFYGKPGMHDPRLEELFSDDSVFGRAVRILEHEPEGWAGEQNLAPLPVRYYESTKPSWQQRYGFWILHLAPATFAAFLVFLLPKSSLQQRLLSATKAFVVVLVVTIVLFSILWC
jgi:hypothetical protein